MGLHASETQVARIQDLFHTLRASVAQKSVACICQNGISGCAHKFTGRPLRASVSEMTLCILFQVTKNQHLDPNFGFYYHIFTTEDCPDRRHRWGSGCMKIGFGRLYTP